MGRGKNIRLSAEQERWLAQVYADATNEEIGRELGVSRRTVNRLAERMGLAKSAEHIAAMQTRAKDKAMESHRRNGTYPGKGFVIPGSEAHRFKKGVSSAQRLGPEREAERLRKSAETRRKTLAAEKRRVLFGLEQRTKLKIGCSRRKIECRHELRLKGYEVARGASEAWVVEGARRSARLEARAKECGIRIKAKVEDISEVPATK